MASGTVRFEPNDDGIRDWLVDNLGDRIEEDAIAMAEAIANEYDVEVDVETMITDRPRAVVMIKDPRGMLLQARDGALTRAAADRGYEVREVE